MKSVFQSGPLADVTESVFKRLSELNGAPGNEIQHYYLFEYIPHRVALGVPEGATAFLRTPRGMTGSALKWTRNTPSLEEAAKRAARELTNIVAEAEARVSGEDKLDNSGYGNFSQYLLPRFLYFESAVEELAGGTGSEVQLLDDSNSRVLFGPNYGRLQRLKAHYDPNNVFSKWFPIFPNPGA